MPEQASDRDCFFSSEYERTAFDDQGAFEAFAALMKSTWWERLWVVQETVLPTEALLVFGSISANWETIIKAVQSIRMHRRSCCKLFWNNMSDDEKRPFHVLPRETLVLNATKYYVEHGIDFYRTLWWYRARNASDPRDKIYGLLGIASSVIGKIEPDYSLSKREVYEQATLLCIEESGDLSILKGQRAVGGELPSWIYDWSLPIDASLWNRERGRMRLGVYKAALDTKALVSKVGMSRISLEGVCIDRVATLGEVCHSRNHKRHFRLVRQWHQMAKNSCSQHDLSLSANNSEEIAG